jgi:hypothetical protein
MTNYIPDQQFDESNFKKMTTSLRTSRDVSNKKYTSASIVSRGSMDEPSSAGYRNKSGVSKASSNKFGSKKLWGR